MIRSDVASPRLVAVAAALVLGATAIPAVAQDRAPDMDNLEVTMRLLPEGATRPDAVTRVIELPEALRSRLADEASATDGEEDGVASEFAGGALTDDAMPGREDRGRTDFGEVARTAIDRVRGLARGQGGAADDRGAAEPSRDLPVAAGRGPAAAAASAAEAGAAARERARDTVGAARDIEREVAERAREVREEASRGRADRPAAAEPDRGRPDRPNDRPNPGRGRPDRP